MKKLSKAIWENKWSPFSLLNYVVSTRRYKLETPNNSIFSPPPYYEVVERTPLGEWVDNLPGIFGLLYTIIHYAVFSIIFIVLVPIIGTVKLVINLLTKSWSDMRF